MTTQETTCQGVCGAGAWRWAWLAAVLVWPVFAHGCHAGDHDDELSIASPKPERGGAPAVTDAPR